MMHQLVLLDSSLGRRFKQKQKVNNSLPIYFYKFHAFCVSSLANSLMCFADWQCHWTFTQVNYPFANPHQRHAGTAGGWGELLEWHTVISVCVFSSSKFLPGCQVLCRGLMGLLIASLCFVHTLFFIAESVVNLLRSTELWWHFLTKCSLDLFLMTQFSPAGIFDIMPEYWHVLKCLMLLVQWTIRFIWCEVYINRWMLLTLVTVLWNHWCMTSFITLTGNLSLKTTLCSVWGWSFARDFAAHVHYK